MVDKDPAMAIPLSKGAMMVTPRKADSMGVVETVSMMGVGSRKNGRKTSVTQAGNE